MGRNEGCYVQLGRDFWLVVQGWHNGVNGESNIPKVLGEGEDGSLNGRREGEKENEWISVSERVASHISSKDRTFSMRQWRNARVDANATKLNTAV